jgi:hypothetical protein
VEHSRRGAGCHRSRPESAGDEFLVELISAMGWAALIGRIPWRYWPLPAIPVGAGATVAILICQKKKRAHSAKD